MSRIYKDFLSDIRVHPDDYISQKPFSGRVRILAICASGDDKILCFIVAGEYSHEATNMPNTFERRSLHHVKAFHFST